MSLTERWMLPEGVDELLPPDAWALEKMRREMLDTYSSYGYELVSPPLVEFLESLLTGTGSKLDLQTFKVTDQLSGRTLGIRSDITTQAARIDAHVLKNHDISRLCYVDSVLHTRPEHTMTNRSPMQIGCELFGSDNEAADLEVMSLMLETLTIADVSKVHVDLAHVGIYRGLMTSAELPRELEDRIFSALNRKSIPELDTLAAEHKLPVIDIIREIALLSGSIDALSEVRKSISQYSELASNETLDAVDALMRFAELVGERFPEIELGYDFCELRGYDYHTGVMFSAYTPSFGYALAKGGRYDSIGAEFGESRPATGFSADLKTLVRLQSRISTMNSGAILAPYGTDKALLERIADLRQTQRVVQSLSESDEQTYGCSKKLAQSQDGQWVVVEI
ncbi:MAG: ATP phosphoribosyltransferase regulatory subunit [Oleiphilaceae bacterium]|nr:ATP phosphoribosyltransferase regulatory subunit [Oleiphilaceae bacterium]